MFGVSELSSLDTSSCFTEIQARDSLRDKTGNKDWLFKEEEKECRKKLELRLAYMSTKKLSFLKFLITFLFDILKITETELEKEQEDDYIAELCKWKSYSNVRTSVIKFKRPRKATFRLKRQT